LTLSGIPAGLRIGFKGEIDITSETGGSILVTFKLDNMMPGESLKVIIDGETLATKDFSGFEGIDSYEGMEEINLTRGYHTIEIAGES
jgi:hypothetical protein